MANNAERCAPLASHWLHLAALMCDGTLTVQFKNGFTCNYLGSRPAHYYSLIAAPSPGRWLHRNLYRLLPYRPCALPCPPAGCGVATTCCPGVLIPATLHATGNLGMGTIPLLYDGSIYW